jgi:glycosyltransferase involved in cell wall biosynthesis
VSLSTPHNRTGAPPTADLATRHLPARLSVDPRTGRLVDDRAASPPAASPPGAPIRVVLPVFNEAGLIRGTFKQVEAFAARNPDYAFLFVDDGSSDATPALLVELIAGARTRGVRGIDLLARPRNAGKGAVIKAGFERAVADGAAFVLFTDGDLAYPLDHLPPLIDALSHADVAIGSRGLVARDERNTTPLRKLMGWCFNRCARVVLGLPYRDTQAGLKGFRAAAASDIFARQRLGGFAFDVELVFLARRLGYRVAEIPARVSEEHSYKRSKVRLLRDPARMFLALIDVRLNALCGRYGRPQRR